MNATFKILSKSDEGFTDYSILVKFKIAPAAGTGQSSWIYIIFHFGPLVIFVDVHWIIPVKFDCCGISSSKVKIFVLHINCILYPKIVFWGI